MERERPSNAGLYRTSSHINRHPAVNLHHATRYSERIGLPLNTAVTINLGLLGCRPDEAGLRFRTLLAQRFAPWLRRNSGNVAGVAPTYVWSMEAAGNQTAAHWLVHVPARLTKGFKRKLDEWLAAIAGGECDPHALNLKPIDNLVGIRRYILKGTDPVWARHLGVRHLPQGKVIGKRSGFSRNLGPVARKRGGYVPRRMPVAK